MEAGHQFAAAAAAAEFETSVIGRGRTVNFNMLSAKSYLDAFCPPFLQGLKAKVQASIQGDTVRVSGRDRDTLQQVIASLKAKDFGIDMQFTNYRSN